MPFEWKEFLDLAQFLVANKDSGKFTEEAGLRSAISRAYYAAFRHAVTYAKTHQGYKPTGTSDDHADVREHFRRAGMSNIAQRLDDLRQRRNECDYNNGPIFQLSLQTTNAIIQAQKVFDALSPKSN